MSDFRSSVDAEGVATITWDVPGARMNVMTAAAFSELEELFDAAIADDRVKGVVITSGKKDFAGGMDLNALSEMSRSAGEDPARGIFDEIMRIHGILRKIERAGMDPASLEGGKPVAAALTGTAMGIGYEIPLACHRVFCADSPGARIGLPEVRVGLFPAAGGTTRLVRKLGLFAASPFLFRGKAPDPKAALAAGLVDEIATPEALLETARKWVLAAAGKPVAKPWDRRGYRMPGGRPYDKEGFPVFLGASSMVNAETQGVYPAAKAMLSAIYEGAQVPFDTALRIEARWFTKLLMDPSPSAMIRTLFVSKKALEKGERRPASAPRREVRRLGVLGAGMMGSGIALVSAQAGIDVSLADQDLDRAAAGKSAAERILAGEAKRGRISAAQMAETLSRIRAEPDCSAFADCDLVIEAVFEDPAVKADMISRVGAAVGEQCIVATNTSTLPVTGLADAAPDPGRFLGIHFFSPVHKMLLVEVIRGRKTSDDAVALALDYVSSIRKTPIVVNDGRFFYANRCVIPYLNEAIRMVGEGVGPALIENCAKRIGMPVGPLQLVDETSIELAASIAKASRSAMGAAYPDDDVDAVVFGMVELGRLGRKARAGFYEYDDSGKRLGLWRPPDAIAPSRAVQPNPAEVRERLLMAQVLAAVRALEEGVLDNPAEGDVGAVLGWGFAPWSGGPFSWLDATGAGRAVEICDRLAARHGERFRAPELLAAREREGRRFH